MILTLTPDDVALILTLVELGRNTNRGAAELTRAQPQNYDPKVAVLCDRKADQLTILHDKLVKQTQDVQHVTRTITYQGSTAALEAQLGRSMSDGIKVIAEMTIAIDTVEDTREKPEVPPIDPPAVVSRYGA